MYNNQEPIKLNKGYEDFNGLFVTKLIYNGEEAGFEDEIQESLFHILNKRKCTGAEHPVQIDSERYPEYSKEEIQEHYKKKGADCVILSEEKEILIAADEEEQENGCDIINYTLLLPLRYVVHLFLQQYDDNRTKLTKDLKEMTKKELKMVLKSYQANIPETYINHSIIMIDMSTGMAFNIGS